MFNTERKILSNQKGLSLIEILIALSLLAFAGTFVATKIFEQFKEGKEQSTRIQIQSVGKILQEYRRKCGRYPTTDQGLDALISNESGKCKRYPSSGFIDEVPLDAFDNEFEYSSDGRKYTLTSMGDDGEPDTEDDISSDKKSRSDSE